MKQICDRERTMIDDGILASDNVTVVASPRH
jgi:hypothetical protein